MDRQYKKGQKLIVSLNFSGEVFEGEYQNGSLTRIDLSNVIDQMTGLKVGDMLTFYESEIESIKLLHQEEDNINSPSKDTFDLSFSKDVIIMKNEEYERLKELYRNYTYISVVDKRYMNATEHLSSCEHVAVAAIGCEHGRKHGINLLVLCSWDHVYIFDIKMFRFKKFMPELKEIFESEEIKKVVHNSRVLADCLWHCHDVSLKNVFDTQVADVMLSKKSGCSLKKMRTVSECLNHYLNFPLSLLDKALVSRAFKRKSYIITFLFFRQSHMKNGIRDQLRKREK